MKSFRLNFKLTAAAMMALAAVSLALWIGFSVGGTTPDLTETSRTAGTGSNTGRDFAAVSKPQPRDSKARAQSSPQRAAEMRLRELLAVTDFHAIHEELAALAEKRQLAGISELLRDWCREGNLELAQWCMLFSAESDPALHLGLCAEALSNPSEAIRESASAELENVSGIRFKDSAHASSWLASHPLPDGPQR